jgi:hypothetical protein
MIQCRTSLPLLGSQVGGQDRSEPYVRKINSIGMEVRSNGALSEKLKGMFGEI